MADRTAVDTPATAPAIRPPRTTLGPASVAAEYQALTAGVALVDRSHVGRLSASGEDALDLLDRLSTNALARLDIGSGAFTVLTSNKGRIVDLLFVLRQADRLLVLTAPEGRQKVADWVDFYTITEDVAVLDVTEETAMPALVGPKAAALLDELTGLPVSDLDANACLEARIGGIETLVVRTDFCGRPAFDLVAPAEGSGDLRERILERGADVGVAPAGHAALEAVRIDRGVPVYGAELGEEYNPLEAGLLKYISFDKGCYVGQEVVARLNTYKKVQKYLVGMTWDSDVKATAGGRLLLDGKQVGVVTSTTRSPGLDRNIALAYVRKARSEPNTELTLEIGSTDVQARVVELPFTP